MATSVSLNTVILVSPDPGGLLAFYRRLGLEPEGVWPDEQNPHHATIHSGDFAIEIDSVAMTKSYDHNWPDPLRHSRTILSFRVADREGVDTVFADMTAAGYHGHLEPFDAFWGARYAIIEDPDGNQVGIMSPPDPEHHGEPPAL
jgi:uncharacterized glyoxalase superfamily protein PhnB